MNSLSFLQQVCSSVWSSSSSFPHFLSIRTICWVILTAVSAINLQEKMDFMYRLRTLFIRGKQALKPKTVLQLLIFNFNSINSLFWNAKRMGKFTPQQLSFFSKRSPSNIFSNASLKLYFCQFIFYFNHLTHSLVFNKDRSPTSVLLCFNSWTHVRAALPFCKLKDK